MYKIMISLLLFAVCGIITACSAQKPTTRLIIRGDDMGFSHSGNLALIKTYEEGIEQSIEVLVPSPWFPEAVRMLAAHPAVDVGIHLALTSEWDNVKWRPLTPCPSLTDSLGYFWPMSWPNEHYPGKSIREQAFSLAEIEQEFRAQIQLALKCIPRISHVSGHMGVTNLNDSVIAITKRLAKEFNIDIDLGNHDVQSASFEGPHKTLAEKKIAFINMLDKLEKGKTYLFVEHPGIDDEELRAIHHIGYENVAEDRQGVTDLYTDPEIRKAIQQRGIELVSYKDLRETSH